MSGIAGIYHLDGAPVDPQVLQRMAAAAAFRGPDGIHFWIDGYVGLAHLALHTTPEALRERQPLLSRDGRLCLAADARVDNRQELISTLTSKGVSLEDPTDADLILAAYEVWGTDCPKEIIGDFAFAVWDSRERRLFLTRDPIGIRPLFYCRRGQTLYFASTISSIVAGLGERPALNEPLVVDYLCWRFDRWVRETVYEGIFRVPGAHGLDVQPEEDRLARYWNLGAQPAPRYSTDQEYVQHFYQLFQETVRCRLRSTTPVGIQVSGGLDSSSIACLAHRLQDGASADVQSAIRLYSYTFSGFPGADEREYLQAVADACPRFPVTSIAGEEIGVFEESDSQATRWRDEPDAFPYTGLHTALLGAARLGGCRVILTGNGGDQVLNDSAYWHPQLIPDVGLRRLPSEWRHFWHRTRWAAVGGLLHSLVTPILRPLIPPRLLAWRRRRRIRRALLDTVPAWIPKEQAGPLDEAANAAWERPAAWPSRSAALFYDFMMGGRYAAQIGCHDAIGAHAGVELRYPYLDRRLVDFLLTMPARMRFADGWTKRILREALAGILPDKVRWRKTHGYLDNVIDYRLREQEKDTIDTLLGAMTPDHLDIGKFKAAWQAYDAHQLQRSGQLLAPLLLQVWLQQEDVLA